MTKEDRERAIKKLRNMIGEVSAYCGECKSMDEGVKEEIEAFDIAIQALEQPCEDAISRQTVLDMMQMKMSGKELYKAVYDLPPVTPIRPKGKWETGYTYPDGEYWKCSVCKELIRVRFPMHFCSNCSADMRGKEA